MALRERLELIGITAYLAGVGVWLRARRRIAPGMPLPALLARSAQVAACGVLGVSAGALRDLRHDRGHAWIGALPLRLGALSDAEGRSGLRLLEDGRPLGPAHATREAVQAEGGGRYYHWYRHVVFSTSDGSSPLTNGRRYTVEAA